MGHTLPDGFTARPATREDAGRVANLWNDRSEITRGVRPSTPPHVLGTWNHPRFDVATDSRLVFAPDGALVGYAHVRDVKDPPVDVFGGYSIHPSQETSVWLWSDLLDWMEKEARRVILRAPADARIALVAGTFDEDVESQRALERHGFEYSRTFHLMQIELDAPISAARWPDGIAVRNAVPDEDDVALVKAYQEPFADHYGIIHQPFEAELEEWRQLMQEDGFDASLWFLAFEVGSGEIAGLCVCSAQAPGDPDLGRIGDLGVRPAWRRRGVGKALLLHAFGVLAERGIRGAVLSVDTKSKSGAPALYEKAGMRSVRASHTYVKELRPGRNLVPQ